MIISIHGGETMETRKELALELKVSERTLDRYREQGMPFIQVSKAVRFEKDEVIKWLRENSK